MLRRMLAFMVVASAVAVAVVVPVVPASAAGLVEVTNFGSNPGQLKMFEYVPAGLPANAPLVVLMHGCGQKASWVDDETGWTALADQRKVILVLPESDQPCFGVGTPADQTRGGGGDADSVKQMVDWEKAHRSVNSSRVFATGFSSGAEMTNVMLGTYPDVFAAGASVAGIPFQCATDLIVFAECNVGGGRDLTPQQWGALARNATPGSWTWPRMAILHGTTDPVVASSNLREQMEQWTNLNGIDQTPEVSDFVNGYPHAVYRNAAGQTRVETFSITGSGHSNLVDVGNRPGQCGFESLTGFTFDVNLCGAYWAARFFGLITDAAPSRTLLNTVAQDGTVKAFTGNLSPVVGTDERGGLQIGRAGDLRVSRAFLSFDTSSIPDTATIGRAWLFIHERSRFGSPFDDPPGNRIVVDLKTGCFATTCNVEVADYAAAATASSVATIDEPGSPVQWSSDFNAAGRSGINRTGTTQLRLRFLWNQLAVQHLYLGNGAQARLVVEY